MKLPEMRQRAVRCPCQRAAFRRKTGLDHLKDGPHPFYKCLRCRRYYDWNGKVWKQRLMVLIDILSPRKPNGRQARQTY